MKKSLPLALCILSGVYTAHAQSVQNEVRPSARVESGIILESSEGRTETTIELVLDFAAVIDENAVGGVLNNLVEKLNVQYRSIYGTEENHFFVAYPLTGLTRNRFGRGGNAVSTWGITVAGVGGKKTFFLKKINDKDLKLVLDAKVIGSYITSTDNRDILCEGCVTTAIEAGDNSSDFVDPRSLDFAVQSNLSLSVEYDRFKLTGYYRGFVGTGGGYISNENTYRLRPHNLPSSVDSIDQSHGVQFNQNLRNNSFGLRLDYQINDRFSVFGGVELNRTTFSEGILEDDINGTYTESVEELVTLQDGTTTSIMIDQTRDINLQGHQQNTTLRSYNTQFSAGLRINLGRKKRRRRPIDF